MERQDHSHPKYSKTEVEVKIEDTIREIIRIGIDQTIGQVVEIEDNSDKAEVDTDLSKVIGEIIGKMQEIMEDKTVEESMKVIIIEVVVMIEVGICLVKGCFPETMTIIELGVQAIVDQAQDLEPVQTGME